jgi:hypothetical protein
LRDIFRFTDSTLNATCKKNKFILLLKERQRKKIILIKKQKSTFYVFVFKFSWDQNFNGWLGWKLKILLKIKMFYYVVDGLVLPLVFFVPVWNLFIICFYIVSSVLDFGIILIGLTLGDYFSCWILFQQCGNILYNYLPMIVYLHNCYYVYMGGKFGNYEIMWFLMGL